VTQNEMEKPEIIEDLGRDTVLCALSDIEDPGSKGFRVGRRERLFVVRKGDDVFAYMNLCPHQGVTLDWKPDAFLTSEAEYILCAVHGALFEIEDGMCVYGPCLGRSLAPIEVRIEDGNIMLDS
tara:strand:+ start:29391 stop:29762 length:372 start_codon:yes stop_codon:yes gene_type:complete